MKIQVPKGTVKGLDDDVTIDAPDDADPSKVVREFQRQSYINKLMRDEPGEYDPNSLAFKRRFGANADSGAWQRFLEGIGSGMVNMARRGANLVETDEDTMGGQASRGGPRMVKHDPNAFGSKEKIAEQESVDKELTDTTAGMLGKIAGETAITLPLGGAAGAGVKALAGARGLVSAAPLLARTLGSAPARSAVEGTVSGFIGADPEARGEGAALGGGLGAGFTMLSKAGGRLLKGLVKRSDAADDLSQIASQHGDDIHVPLSQAAGEQDIPTRLVKTLYRSVLPNIPGVEGRLVGQSEDALKKVRQMVLKEATPEGISLPANAVDDISSSVRTLRAGFDKSYEDIVKTETFRIPKKITQGLETFIRSKIPSVDDTSLNRAVSGIDSIIDRFRSGNLVVDGTNILNIKNEISALIKQTANQQEKQALIQGQKVVDGIIKSKLAGVGDKLAKYEALNEPYANLSVLRKAAAAAKPNKGNFSPNQLARASKDPSQMLHLAQTANQVLGKAPTRSTTAGKILTGLALGGTGYGVGLPAVAAAVGAGHVLASKGAQKLLMGSTRAQRMIANQLRKHGRKIRIAGSAIRASMTTNAGDSDAR